MDEPATQRNLILILVRNLASRLATAFWLIDIKGTVIYFNEAAERLLGRRFVEGRGMAAEEWSRAFSPVDEHGRPLTYDDLPLGVSIRERRPDHRTLHIRSAEGVQRSLEVTAIPLFAHPDECVGAMAIFWEVANGA